MRSIFFKFLKTNEKSLSYLFWGGLTTIVSWGTFSLFCEICHMGIILSNGFSWICAISFAYITNKLWVFRSKSWELKLIKREVFLFISTRILTGIFEFVMVPLLVIMGLNQRIAGIEGAMSKIIVSIMVIFANYISSRQVVFRHSS